MRSASWRGTRRSDIAGLAGKPASQPEGPGSIAYGRWNEGGQDQVTRRGAERSRLSARRKVSPAPPPGRTGGRRWRRAVLGLLLGVLLLPSVLIAAFRFVPVPATPLMAVRAAQGYGWEHEWVPLRQMSPALARAVAASEDNLFCGERLGFDEAAMLGQVAAWWRGARPRGASTITMQVAKNVFLWPGRDIVRKLAEAALTPQIALAWPKQRVMEVYLNSVEFGPGIYGAEAASQHFFHRPAARLTPQQAARLAVVLPSPLHWSAADPSPYVMARAAVILRRVEELGPRLACLGPTVDSK